MTPAGSAGTASGSYRVEPEPAGELWEALLGTLVRSGAWPLAVAERSADALLAGPLAPLLAKLRAVEALADEMEHHDAELCSAMAAEKAREFDLASEAAYAMQAADLRMDARRIRRALDAT